MAREAFGALTLWHLHFFCGNAIMDIRRQRSHKRPTVMSKSPNHRPTIAFFTPEIEGEYSAMLCHGVLECAAEKDVNVIVFPGKAINSPYPYQHQYNVIYDLVTPENVDAIIVPISIFHVFPTKKPIEDFFYRFFPVPMVTINTKIGGATGITIDNKSGLRSLLNHLIKEHGKKRIAFIRGPTSNADAEERFDVYCDVLLENNIRPDPGLVCPGDFTAGAVPGALGLLIDERGAQFDAIVAANDEMALAALTLLRERRIRVPEDVVVTGFDNVYSSRTSVPPLTTVRQPLLEVGKCALKQALALLAGEPETTVVLPTELVIRNSCGCTPVEKRKCGQKGECDCATGDKALVGSETTPTVRVSFGEAVGAAVEEILAAGGVNALSGPELYQRFTKTLSAVQLDEVDFDCLQDTVTRVREEYMGRAGNDAATLRRTADLFDMARLFFSEIVQTKETARHGDLASAFRNLRNVLYAMYPFVDNNHQAVVAAAEPLKAMGLRNCAIYLYEDEIFYPYNQPWVSPEAITLAMAFSEEFREIATREGLGTVPTRSILCNDILPSKRRYDLVVSPLFFLNYQMGLIVCDLDPDYRLVYESLFVEMGCVLKFSHFISVKNHFESRLRDALHELERHNRLLNNLSQTDELTGLSNRRGFLAAAQQSLDAALERNARGLLFYADIDGLKTINDNYGHEEGDGVIKAAAMLLKKAFRSSDIVGRMGGDEFTVFTVDTTLSSKDAIGRRLACLIDEFNAGSDKPYRISMSYGVAPFPGSGETTIETLLSEADQCLYEQKRNSK